MVYDARGNGDGNTVPTMTGDHGNRVTDYTGLVVELDRASFNQGKIAQFDIGISEDGVAHTVLAKGPGAVIYKEAYGFDQGASRDVGDLFIEDCPKTLANGTCPGHHNGVVIKTIALEGNGQRLLIVETDISRVIKATLLIPQRFTEWFTPPQKEDSTRTHQQTLPTHFKQSIIRMLQW